MKKKLTKYNPKKILKAGTYAVHDRGYFNEIGWTDSHCTHFSGGLPFSMEMTEYCGKTVTVNDAGYSADGFRWYAWMVKQDEPDAVKTEEQGSVAKDVIRDFKEELEMLIKEKFIGRRVSIKEGGFNPVPFIGTIVDADYGAFGSYDDHFDLVMTVEHTQTKKRKDFEFNLEYMDIKEKIRFLS